MRAMGILRSFLHLSRNPEGGSRPFLVGSIHPARVWSSGAPPSQTLRFLRHQNPRAPPRLTTQSRTAICLGRESTFALLNKKKRSYGNSSTDNRLRTRTLREIPDKGTRHTGHWFPGQSRLLPRQGSSDLWRTLCSVRKRTSAG